MLFESFEEIITVVSDQALIEEINILATKLYLEYMWIKLIRNYSLSTERFVIF